MPDLDGLAPKILRPVESSTWDRASVDQIHKWYDHCRESHIACAKPGTVPTRMPTRLLDLRDRKTIRLLDTKKSLVSGSYATLSHCWGDFVPVKLLTTNMQSFKEGIPRDELPLTFLEAIDASIMLDVQFLWIDSLCIIQDSLDDWRKESMLMGDVYNGGSINIAATSSRNGKGGLFRLRNPLEISRCVISTSWEGMEPLVLDVLDEDLWRTEVSMAPLNQRGWVFQERLLSPRTIHFGRSQLFWECKELMACEAFPQALPKVLEPRFLYTKMTDLKEIREVALNRFGNDLSTDTGYLSWYNWIQQYSRTSVTKSSDKLIAVGALARYMEKELNDSYLAGLWLGDMPGCLLWRTRADVPVTPAPRKPKCHRSPSWSWASIDGEITFDWRPSTIDPWDERVLEQLVSLQRVETWPRAGFDATGEVVGGLIEMQGILFQTTIVGELIRDPSDFRHGRTNHVLKATIGISEMPFSKTISHDVPPEEGETPTVMLPIYQWKCPNRFVAGLSRYSDTVKVEGLMVRQLQDHPVGWYERLGYFQMEFVDVADFGDLIWSKQQQSALTLEGQLGSLIIL